MRALDRLRTWILAILALLLLVFVGVIAVGAVSFALKSLWGELLFAVVGASVSIAICAKRLPEKFWKKFRVRPPPVWQAPILAAVALVALPIAVVKWPLGAVVLGAAFFAGLALSYAVPRSEGRKSVAWAGFLAALAATLAFAYLGTRTADAVPVPEADRSAPFPGADLLAVRFRPQLFFDTEERFIPLDIEAAMRGGDVQMCRNTLRGKQCERVPVPEEVDASFDYLTLRGDQLDVDDTPGGPGSAYYYHVVPRDGRVYVDYWWFFAQNPSPVAKRAVCGPGLRTSALNCFDHPADWEGVTVVLTKCAPGTSGDCFEITGGAYAPEAVHYSQHGHAVRFAWSKLEGFWSDFPRWFDAPEDHVGPLVFVARDSHASYPRPCQSDCHQTGSVLGDGDHDGGLHWANNDACGGCLKPLPTTAEGDAALWNAFPGPWGAQRCILAESYCDVGRAPTAPGSQERYRHPEHVDRVG
jgi:hypothetical protein